MGYLLGSQLKELTALKLMNQPCEKHNTVLDLPFVKMTTFLRVLMFDASVDWP